MKMIPVSNKPTQATQFFQDHVHSPHLWWSGCNWRSGVTGKSPGSNEGKWGHNTFFANKSRPDGDRGAQMVPNDLTRRAASYDVHINLPGSWSDLELTLTWPEVKFWNWPFKVKSTCSEPTNTMVFRIFHIKKVIKENHPRAKRYSIWWPLEQTLLTYGQSWSENVTRAWRELPNTFLNSSYLSYISR